MDVHHVASFPSFSPQDLVTLQVGGTGDINHQARREKLQHDRILPTSLENRLTRMENLIRSQNEFISQTSYNGSDHHGHHLQDLPSQNLSSSFVNADSAFLEKDWSHSRSAPLTYSSEAISMESTTAAFPLPDSAFLYQGPWDSHSQEHFNAAQSIERNWIESAETIGQVDVSTIDEEESVLMPQRVNEEQKGPEFWLSICSPPLLAWVYEKTGLNDFAQSVQQLTNTWFRQLKMDRNSFTTQTEEPDPELAWKYCNAYFEQSIDSVFGIVDRPEFENHLRDRFRGDLTMGSDPAWYALRNCVYASGCRIYRAKDPSVSFGEIQEEAWRYFQNALSVHGEVLLTCTDLLAVRSLLAMTVFAEGLGSPALGYMLCANAARLAQSQGLHHQPSKAWNLAEDEVVLHNWLFWAVYCCEKQIAQRCGRPSAIDDDEISCQIPNQVSPGSTIDIEAFTHLILQSQLSSEISRQLMSAKALQKSPSALLDTARELGEQLQSWKESLPTNMRPKDHLTSFQVPQNARPLSKIILQYSYYGNLISIHTPFAYPWMFEQNISLNPSEAIDEQLVTSSNIVADAARNIIVIARNVEITGTSTQGSMLYYPMVALIHLFLYVLRFPTIPSARSDTALLDVAAGYFGHMDIVTGSELSFPFARDVAVLARMAVNKAVQSNALTGSFDNIGEQTGQSMDFAAEGGIYNADDFILDDWGVF